MRAVVPFVLALLVAGSAEAATIDPATISPTADRDFWCATAFGLIGYNLKTAGDEAGSQTANNNMLALFQQIANQMKDKGLAKDDYDALVAQYTATVMDPFRDPGKTFSREDCDAAAKAAPPVEQAPAAQ